MPLTIPPYRAALLTNADGSPVTRAGPNGDGDPVATERQWYMFWQNAAQQINDGAALLGQLAGLVDYGNHADRPDPQFGTDGALYVEWDRGSVLYQNQGGVWEYIAGIMYGTLAPDQRPTDLGPAADVGFQFRTTTDPARAFTWSGTKWIETTPIRYGTHAARLAETIANLVSGMLWMETDRGSVLYQNQGGVWLFLTGTMWGTLSPDQRPADLGVKDAGFDFRSTSPPPREFIWNQTAWVEVTALVDPTTTQGDLIARGAAAPATRLGVGADGQVLTADSTQALGVKWAAPPATVQDNLSLLAQASLTLTLTTTPQNIAGAVLTLPRAGKYLVIGVYYFIFSSGDNGATLIGLFSGNTSYVAAMSCQTTGSVTVSVGATVTQQWLYTASAGTIVTLQAYKSSGAGSSQVSAAHTTIMAVWVSP